MVDGSKRQAPSPGDRLRGGHTDEQRSDQTRTSCYADELDVIEPRLRLVQCFPYDGGDQLEVPARCDLWHHAAVTRMEIDLRCDDVGKDPPLRRDQRSGRLVTRGLEPQD